MCPETLLVIQQNAPWFQSGPRSQVRGHIRWLKKGPIEFLGKGFLLVFKETIGLRLTIHNSRMPTTDDQPTNDIMTRSTAPLNMWARCITTLQSGAGWLTSTSFWYIFWLKSFLLSSFFPENIIPLVSFSLAYQTQSPTSSYAMFWVFKNISFGFLT